ncbi:Rod shape-determining protein MreD [Sphingomonas antarctica]|uniref:rod shape-determining protein MreD n=1 Tax=Sphingomonas antarctica TaxID=2040274 RepID=UPI0039E74C78
MRLSIVRSQQPLPPIARLALPVVSIMLGSLLVLIPVIATVPVVPSFGFLMLLGWRLLRGDLIAPWAGIPLGLFDDLFSGAPLGTGMASWTFALLVIEAIDRRVLFRDAWQDWGIAAGLIAMQLLMAWALSGLTGAIPYPYLLAPQWLCSILCYPLAVRLAAWLDRRRTGR